MSNASKNHWRDNESQYTFSQYVFYLILLGLVMAALVVYIVWFMRPPKVAESKVIIWISKQGGERPIIPFQNNDIEILRKRLTHTEEIYDFDDKPQFDPDSEQMLADHVELGAEDSTFVLISGVGVVEDEQPCLMTSTRGQHIKVQRIFETLLKLNSEKVVVLLDCGHKPFDRDAYELNSERAHDANEFVNYVRSLEFSPEMHRKFSVVMTSDHGHRPLYSTTRRRSLFGLALEKTLEQENAFENVEAFVASLDANMLSHGGKSAPECVLKKGDAFGDASFAAIELEEPEEEERRADAPFFTPTKDTEKLYERMDTTWQKYIASWEAAEASPVTLNGPAWHRLTDDMVRMSHQHLADAQLELDQLSTRIDNFIRLSETTQAVKKLRNIVGKKEESPSEEALVLKTIDAFYAAVFRLRYYTAVYDDLSWIMPGNGRLGRFRKNIDAVLQSDHQRRKTASTGDDEPQSRSLADPMPRSMTR